MPRDLSPLGRAALYYIDLGWFIAPVKYGTKDPPLTAHGFKDASKNPDHIREWIAKYGRCNWLLWPAPSGLLVIDWETDAGRQTMQEWGLSDVSTLRVSTARGAHHYFTSPSVDIETTTLGAGTTIRHRKGYVLVPPSQHPSGHIYRWEGTAVDLRPLPESVLARLQVQPDRPAQLISRPNAVWTELPPALERRIRTYLDKLPTGLREGGGRNSTGYSLAAFLVRDLQLSDRLALQWLDAWNARQADPLTARELDGVMTHAHAYGRHPYGAGLERRRTS